MNFLNNVTITLSDKEMTKIKVIDLDELYNFVIDDFFSWKHLVFENVVWSCHIFKFKFKFKLFKKCYIYRSWWVIQLCCWWLFQLKSFSIWKCCLKLSYFKIQIQIVKKILYRKMAKIKVIDLDELYNFVVDSFSIWNHLLPEKLFEFLIFLNSNFI